MKLADLKKDLDYGQLIKDSSVLLLARSNAMAIFRAMPFTIEELHDPIFSSVESVRQRVEELKKFSFDLDITTNLLFAWMFTVGNHRCIVPGEQSFLMITIRIESVATFLACHNIRIMWFPCLTYSQIHMSAEYLIDPVFYLSDACKLDLIWEDLKVEEPGLVQLERTEGVFSIGLLQHLAAIGDIEGITREVLRLTSSSIEYVTEDDLTQALIRAWEDGGK